MEKSTIELNSILKNKRDYDYEEFVRDYSGEMIYINYKYLNTLLKRSGLNQSQLSNITGINKKYINELFRGIKNNPSRDKVLLLSFAMHLNEEEASRLLKLYGHSELYVRQPRDLAIMFALNKGKSIIEINEELEDSGFDILE